MKILIVGAGGREHTFVWKIAQSPRVTRLYAAPGNAGMAQQAQCVDIASEDIDGLLAFAQQEGIDLTLIGPENPLADGIVDRFQESGLTIFGPTQAAAQIEADKEFALELMHKYGIPTGDYRSFTDPEAARACVREWDRPLYFKASGLAMGKGAIPCPTADAAFRAIEKVMVDRVFGAAGDKVVLMEWLEGEEASIFGFTDGEHIVCLVPSQDHKTIGEGDTGPNTGGMGAYAPAPVVTPELQQEIYDRIMQPTVQALAAEGRPYRGILYGGIILTPDGPKVIEFNCRLGDPEAQVVLPLLKTDLVDLLTGVCEGNLKDVSVEIDNRAATCVVIASGGYPGDYKKGYPISGINRAEAPDDVVLFHAGTAGNDGRFVTNGGRILGVTALGNNIPASIQRAYQAVEKIEFKDMYCRKDIGHRALARLPAPQTRQAGLNAGA